MSTAIMTPVRTSTLTPGRPSGLSRSTATYFSSSLPPPSLPSWSLDHSCTTFGASARSTVQAQHSRSARLIDDEPDTHEEAHMRGIKRNRRAMTKSPFTPSKKRCNPFANLHASPSSIATDRAAFCEPNSNDGMLLPPFSIQNRGLSQTSSLGPSIHDRSVSSYKSEYSASECQSGIEHDEDDEDDCPIPAPPTFRRRSTIRDPFDLASSIEDFKHYL